MGAPALVGINAERDVYRRLITCPYSHRAVSDVKS